MNNLRLPLPKRITRINALAPHSASQASLWLASALGQPAPMIRLDKNSSSKTVKLLRLVSASYSAASIQPCLVPHSMLSGVLPSYCIMAPGLSTKRYILDGNSPGPRSLKSSSMVGPSTDFASRSYFVKLLTQTTRILPSTSSPAHLTSIQSAARLSLIHI